jgi:hypothetical protein
MIPESVSDDVFEKLSDMISDFKICTITQMKRAIKRAELGKDYTKPNKLIFCHNHI